MSNASNGCEVKRRRKTVGEKEGERLRVSAHRYSKQIKSDFILRGLAARSMSWRLVSVSARGPLCEYAVHLTP